MRVIYIILWIKQILKTSSSSRLNQANGRLQVVQQFGPTVLRRGIKQLSELLTQSCHLHLQSILLGLQLRHCLHKTVFITFHHAEGGESMHFVHLVKIDARTQIPQRLYFNQCLLVFVFIVQIAHNAKSCLVKGVISLVLEGCMIFFMLFLLD